MLDHIQKAFRKINVHPSRKDLRGFGLVLLCGAIGFALACQFLWHRADLVRPLLAAGAAALFVVQIPILGRLLYIGWMGIGVAMGLVTSPVFMGLVYLLLFVPLGLVFKLMGRDVLRKQLSPSLPSYWEEYPEVKEPLRYLRQY